MKVKGMKNSTDESDVFKTPSPSRRKRMQRNLFTDRCDRNKGSGKQDKFRNDMESIPSTPTLYYPLQQKRDRSRTDPLPRKFRREMPMSARKVEPTQIPPSEREFLPIVQSSFYGNKSRASSNSPASNDSLSKPLPNQNDSSKIAKDFVTKNRPALHSLPSQNGSALTTKDILPPEKSKGINTSVMGKKHTLLQRNNASGSVMKPKKTNIFGQKGVSHSIKKPKKLIVRPLKKASKATTIKEKSFAQLFRECEEERKKNRKKHKKKSGYRNDSDLTDDNDENQVEPRNMTPKRTGNIALNKNRNVSYEIKNGQPVFRLRRSPRKSLKNAYLEATHERAPKKLDITAGLQPDSNKLNEMSPTPTKRRSSSKLFTPSGDKDYLGLSPKSKERKIFKPNLPSPIKFMADDTHANEDIEIPAVLHIIDHLENSIDTEHPANETSQDNYAMYVTDDEAARLALETVQQLADLEQSFELGNDADFLLGGIEHPEKNLAIPEEVESDLELKLVETDSQESIIETHNSNSTLKPVENSNFQHEFEKENNYPPVETGTPPKNPTANNATSKRLFSIFDNPSTPTQTETQGQNIRTRRSKTITTQAGRDGLTQMIIDAGQKNIGAQHCTTCNFVYSDDPSEQKAHEIRHRRALGYIDFKGWKKENKIDCPDLEGRIVIVKYDDANNHWDKVESVLEMVDTTLGIIPSGNEESSHARNPTQSMAFLFVSSAKQIVGFLLAERITSKTDKISKAKRVLDDNKKEMSERNYVPVMYDLDENIQSKVCTGISRIWVRLDYQRKGIGSRLVEAMRKHFVGYHILSPEEFAFSHTTPNGTDFAISYMAKEFKRMEFFAYAPELGRELSINSIDKTNDRLRH